MRLHELPTELRPILEKAEAWRELGKEGRDSFLNGWRGSREKGLTVKETLAAFSEALKK